MFQSRVQKHTMAAACTSAEWIPRRFSQTNIHHRATNFRDKYFTGDHYALLALLHIHRRILLRIACLYELQIMYKLCSVCTMKSDEFAKGRRVTSTKFRFICISNERC